jgi:hypothetical protein
MLMQGKPTQIPGIILLHITVFTVGTNNNLRNTYVAYLFAHNAGGFGDAGTDNVISCGSLLVVGQVDLGLGATVGDDEVHNQHW